MNYYLASNNNNNNKPKLKYLYKASRFLVMNLILIIMELTLVFIYF